ncbi:VWA domain-containing protein [Verrucomicrobiaceae bacterium N1E253]|uniref:VWA domain-containing protein n=1 Tax=Oceaniferula marina TaxID=2748318 RepID=A0A851GJ31_9BACT|nr:VWA domain-containing protein [Oceaniferula marina]NWK54214.1 VWA domain-containing protein [Oceaniferula marina]
MKELIFYQPWMIVLLLLVPVMVVLFQLRLAKQRRDLSRFGQSDRGSKAKRSHYSMEPWRLGLLIGACLMVVIALMRPAVNPHPKLIQRDGRDLVFLLDVSKSMLADDLQPNRLEVAKNAIAECVVSLQDHRVGLVVFAGSSSIACPLTTDRNFFLNSLEKVGPDSVAHGGTRIGDALLKVCDKLFSDQDHGYKDIVLLSDGGDQSSGLGQSIDQMNALQIRLIAIGMGDPDQGARIPSSKGASDFVMYQGQEVWTKMDGAQLSGLVKRTEQAAYLPVGKRRMNLAHIYKRLSEQGGTQMMAEESVIDYDEIFQVFIALSIFLLVVMAFTPHTFRRTLIKSSMVLALLIPIIAGVGQAEAGETEAAFSKGNSFYRKGHYEDAIAQYESALKNRGGETMTRDLSYNLGNAYYQLSKQVDNDYTALALINQSVDMYRRLLRQNDSDLQAAINNEVVRAARRKMEQKIKQDEERRQKMQAAMELIRQRLISLIERQGENLPQADEPEDQPLEEWVSREQKIADGTDRVSALLIRFNETFFEGVPKDLTPMAQSQKHVSTAFLHQREGIMVFSASWPGALEKGRASMQSLQDALAALPQDSEGSGQDGDQEEGESDEESESGDEGEESDGDEGESESSEADDGEMSESSQSKTDLESIDLPPPSNSPEEVIRMSQEMQEARQAAGAKKKGKPVDKDW